MSSPTQFKGTLVVTGGSGYIGAQIVRAALTQGYAVRLTARTAASASQAAARHPQFADTPQLTTSVVGDITDASAYAPVFAGGAVTGVVHAASPFNVQPSDNVRDLLTPAVRGSTAVLEAARRWGGPRVRRVVVTSSFGAVVDPGRGARPGYVYAEADWNPTSWDEAAVADGVVAYCTSKSLAERAAWDWVAAQKKQQDPVSFDLATICPPWVFGPYAGGLRGAKSLSESIDLLRGIVDAAEVPPFDFGGFADVRVVAEAHIRALEVPEAGGQRFLIGQDYRHQLAVDIAREAFPELRDRLPEGRPGHVEPAYSIDGSKASRVLGIKYRTLDETIKDTFEQLLRDKQIEEKA
ncbi:NAD(P)-binding protein [Biscogniauxia marginata]|nr:NAD(P)-binding protein [Biscogniauxia marginata]